MQAPAHSTPRDPPGPAGVSFEHLSNAPIVESVIEFRARVETAWEEEWTVNEIKQRLPEYPNRQTMRGYSLAVTVRHDSPIPQGQAGERGPTTDAQGQDLGWFGVRVTSADQKQIAVFGRDFFSFSRLKPYEDWQRFSGEALRLWALHRELSGVSSLQRIGARYINRLQVPREGLEFDQYFGNLGPSPGDLPVSFFLHRYTLAVPDERIGVNLVRTFEPPASEDASQVSLLLDVDAHTTEPLPAEDGTIMERLQRLREWKNRVFFGSWTPRALDLCR